MSQPDIHLFTAATMNGYKPVIFLEEAGVPYDLTFINFSKQEQKTPEFLARNPNGKIPVIEDRAEGRAIFESGAILWHLAEKYGRFLPADPVKRSEVMQWMLFQVGHVGPMMGQAMYFQRIAAPNGHQDDFAIERYVDESRRLLEVLDRRLDGRDFVLDGGYSIVDMALYPYARSYPWARVPVDDLEHLGAWFARVGARPAVQRALQKPRPVPAFFGQVDASAHADEERANAARFARD